MSDLWTGPSPRLQRAFDPVAGLLGRYHRHDIVGLDHVPREGGALLVIHHSFATYDAILLGYRIGVETGRFPASLGDDKLFALPFLRDLSERAGIHPASPEAGRRLLDAGNLVAVAPGGMREALRPSTERRMLRWDKRRGFARLAFEARVPILPAACPAADDLYTVYENVLTKLAYRRFKVPVAFVRGLGPTLVPRPVKLVHFIGPPIPPPLPIPGQEEAQIEALHAAVVAAASALLSR